MGRATGNRQQATGDGSWEHLCATVPSAALEALRRLWAAGYEAYLVGGCVRDALLGREPGDWDIATAALPEQVKAVFAGERVIETGLKHGTVTVLLGRTDCHDQCEHWSRKDKNLTSLSLEITTFRTEAGYADHRHPDAVAFTSSLEEDLARRDFTINAMAWDPEEGIVDPFGGRADLEAGVIRCVGDPARRFDEDALRILRALRFSAQLRFSVEADTAAAALALRQTLELVSRERVAAELTKLLCGPDARRVLTEHWPILAVLLPELDPMAGLDQRSKYHCYDVLTHSAAAVEAVPPEKLLRWAALLHDAGKPACLRIDEAGGGHFYGHAKVSAELARTVLTRLRFDKDTVRRIAALVELHDYPIDPPEGSPERAIRKLIGKLGEEDFFRLLALKRADALAHHPDYRGRTAACDRLEALARELLSQPPCFTVKDLAIDGNDLLALGIPRGPELGRTLNALLEAVLDGRAPNEREALLGEVGRKKVSIQ
ncbi:MAG: HD domain-containing protein [Oscillospiraceae bacterium]|nr:HD domain-containing protein [Oscillospiraceae bacterium]MBQ6159497.1 HD domain-containing protein [Oscillospiraceae bacterium]